MIASWRERYAVRQPETIACCVSHHVSTGTTDINIPSTRVDERADIPIVTTLFGRLLSDGAPEWRPLFPPGGGDTELMMEMRERFSG